MRRLLTALTALTLVTLAAAPPALARRVPCGTDGHARCLAWTGKVIFVADGDTVDVRIKGIGTRRVRMISINATELTRYSHKPSRRRGECHAVAATNNLERMIRRGHWRVRLLAEHASSHSLNHRLLRSLQVRSGGRWVDAGAAQLRAGMALWLPKRDEPAWNEGYSAIARRAAAHGVGLYNPTACGRGPAAGARLQVHVRWDAEGNDHENVNGEWIEVRNLDRSRPVRLGGWHVKDSDLKRYRLPSWAKVPAGGSLYVHIGRGHNHGNDFYWGFDHSLFDNTEGDGGYLFDPQGDLRGWDIYDP